METHTEPMAKSCVTEGGIYLRIQFFIDVLDVSSVLTTLDGHLSFA